MREVMIVFELKDRFIERFIHRCALNIELSFYADLLTHEALNTYNRVFTKGIISVTISEAIFLSMFYGIVLRVHEGKTLINPDEIYRSTAIDYFLDKKVFKDENIVDDVDSIEAYELFDKVNEFIYIGIRSIVPVSFVNEFINHILDNKLIIDNMRNNGYYIIETSSRTVISYKNVSGIDSVYTYWYRYNYVY